MYPLFDVPVAVEAGTASSRFLTLPLLAQGEGGTLTAPGGGSRGDCLWDLNCSASNTLLQPPAMPKVRMWYGHAKHLRQKVTSCHAIPTSPHGLHGLVHALFMGSLRHALSWDQSWRLSWGQGYSWGSGCSPPPFCTAPLLPLSCNLPALNLFAAMYVHG